MTSTQSPILTQDDHTTPSVAYRKVQTQGLFKHQKHHPLVRALAFSPDGTLLGGAFERYVVIWRLESAEEGESPGGLENWGSTAIFTLNENAEEELCFFSWANADFLLIGSTYGNVKVGRYTDSGVVKCATFKGFQASLHSIRFLDMHCGGSLLAVAAGDCEVTVWTLNEGGWQQMHNLRLPAYGLRVSSERQEVTFIGWRESEVDNTLVVAYLNHGVFSWNMDSMECVTLIQPDKVYSAALSPDGRYITMPGKRGSFQVFDLERKIKVSTLTEPANEGNGGLRMATCPGRFLLGGHYFLGAGLGKINCWNTSRCIRAQRLDLNANFAKSSVALLAVSNSHSPNAGEDIRIAACTNGPGQEIEVWKSCISAFIPEVKVSPDAAGNRRVVTMKLSSVGIVGALVGGIGIYAAMNWL